MARYGGNPSVATALKLYFKLIPQPMREDHLDIFDSLKKDWK